MARFSIYVVGFFVVGLASGQSRGLGLGGNGHLSVVEPVERFVERRARLMGELSDGILLLHARASIKGYRETGFHQELDFFYFSGLSNLTNAILAVDGVTKETTLFVPTDGAGLAVLAGTTLRGSLETAGPLMREALKVDRVLDWQQLKRFVDSRPQAILYVPGGEAAWPTNPNGMLSVGDPDVLWSQSIRDYWPDRVVQSAGEVVGALRSVKDEIEIAALRAAGEASVEAVKAVARVIAHGVSQRVGEAAVVTACLESGGDGVGFWPWVMSGPNSVFPKPFESFGDYRHKNRLMRDGELVRIDIGCEADFYQGDLGRTFPVSGTFTPGQREAWDLLIAGYRGGLSAIKDGVTWKTVELASRAAVTAAINNPSTAPSTRLGRMAGDTLLDENSMDWHHHAIGLWASEPAPAILRAGMVIDFEPMFAIGEEGYYLEDMILVTNDGYEILTPGLPYTSGEIESLMGDR